MVLKKYILIIAACWLFIISAFTFQQEYILFKGKEVLLKTIPVDPRDLFRGDYVVLNYEIAQIPRKYNYEYNKTVYVSLNVDKNNVGHIRSIASHKPNNNLYLQGKIGRCNTTISFFKTGKCINYGIESYFVKEGEGRKLEQDLRNGAFVNVAIDKNGKAKVKGFKNITDN